MIDSVRRLGRRLGSGWIRFCCRMDWHKEPEFKGFDGATVTGRCPRCRKRVGQDSQGNWFAF
jgi:hypothetical protein